MATVGVGTKSRDKKGFFVSSKEKGRREKLKNIWKRKCCDVEGDGGVSTKKKCIEAGSCNFRGRRVIELDVLARALDSGCRACGKALQLSNCHDETISGLGSFLYIMCSDPECGEVNVCTTNKSHRAAGAGRGRPIFDVNTKLAAGRYIYLISSFYLNILTSFIKI